MKIIRHHKRLACLVLLLVGLVSLQALSIYRHPSNALFLTRDKNGGSVYIPLNLRSSACWDESTQKKIVTLKWDAPPTIPDGVTATYNIYNYDDKIGDQVSGMDKASCDVADAAYVRKYIVKDKDVNEDTTYTVTSVTNTIESIPSNIASLVPLYRTIPSWRTANTLQNPPALPNTPRFVTVYPEWNLGKPRNRVTWIYGDIGANVYRDGILVASGIFGQTYIDTNVSVGESHTYSVSNTDYYWPGNPEGAKSSDISATTLSVQPALLNQKVEITGVRPNDDSVMIFFKPVPGAQDYRAYKVGRGGTAAVNAKYAGIFGLGIYYQKLKFTTEPWEKNVVPATPPAEYSIELNDINPSTGNDIIVEAVDKPGPFQKMDGDLGIGAMAGMNGGAASGETSGMGDPSSVPNVIASSDPFHVVARPSKALSTNPAVTQKFFDDFRNSTQFTKVPVSDPDLVQFIKNNDSNQSWKDDGILSEFLSTNSLGQNKWRVRPYSADMDVTKIFAMNNHFMDTLFDGNSAKRSFVPHNNNASLIMMPQQTADISNGQILHATMQVDAHFDGRRFAAVVIAPKDDPLIDPQAMQKILLNSDTFQTKNSGQSLMWEILPGGYGLTLITKDAGGHRVVTDLLQYKDYTDQSTTFRTTDYSTTLVGQANGSPLEIDKQSRFDLYLSQNHYKFVETLTDGRQIVRENDFPAGVTLPFSQAQVYYDQELYHTSNDVGELRGDQFDNLMWINHRPYSDERHWDNMGFEVLPANSWATPDASPQLYGREAPSFVGKYLTLRGKLGNRQSNHSHTSVKVQAIQNGSLLATTDTFMDGNGTILINDSAFIQTLPADGSYDFYVWPKGYFASKIAGTQVNTALAAGQIVDFGSLNVGNFVSASQTKTRPTLGDLVDEIRAYNGTLDDATAAAYPSNFKVKIGDLVTMIRIYNQ